MTKQQYLTKLIIALLVFFSGISVAAMNHAGMTMDEKGMIMNNNKDKLPKDCKEISEVVNITVRAGQKFARKFNGIMFAYDTQQWNVKPCARINFTFINDDHIRHQLMIHGLPGYLYPKGMFTIELYGEGRKEASLIVPSRRKTYLVHCDISQHTEKGMKAQLKVDGGDGDFPSIPGLTAPVTADKYPVAWGNNIWFVLLLSFLAGCVLPWLLIKNKN
jgi:FtsP/CotA-like multicopper oxidase with cupredoxin domain